MGTSPYSKNPQGGTHEKYSCISGSEPPSGVDTCWYAWLRVDPCRTRIAYQSSATCVNQAETGVLGQYALDAGFPLPIWGLPVKIGIYGSRLDPAGSFLDMIETTPVAVDSSHATSATSTILETSSHNTEAGYDSGIHVVLKAEDVGSFMGFPITNSLVMTLITTALLLGLSAFYSRKLKLIPGKFQAGIEWLFESTLNYMTETLEDEKMARKFFPLIMTIFLFVLVANLLAFVPGVGSILISFGGETVPLLRAPAADLNMTLALALIAFFTIEITGVIALGFFKYSSKYVNFTSPVNFVVGIIELISNIGRLISFSFRLFGNIFAGEILIIVAMYFVAYLLPVPLIAFEVFVAFIQAVVFSMLTLFFIKLGIMEPHGNESH